jgi:hypothetical protein
MTRLLTLIFAAAFTLTTASPVAWAEVVVDKAVKNVAKKDAGKKDDGKKAENRKGVAKAVREISKNKKP